MGSQPAAVFGMERFAVLLSFMLPVLLLVPLFVPVLPLLFGLVVVVLLLLLLVCEDVPLLLS